MRKFHKAEPDGLPVGCSYSECDYLAALGETQLNLHVRNNHGEVLELYCDECSHSDCTEKGLEGHRSVAHQKNEFACFACHFSSDEISALVGHVGRAHAGFEETPLHCAHCGFVGSDLRRLEHHLEEKHAEGALDPCPRCGFHSNHGPVMEAHHSYDHKD